jgi:hypothetical protein
VRWTQRNERIFMMNHADGWMNGWSGGGLWIWPVIGVLLIVVIKKLLKKYLYILGS